MKPKKQNNLWRQGNGKRLDLRLASQSEMFVFRKDPVFKENIVLNVLFGSQPASHEEVENSTDVQQQQKSAGDG